MYLYINGTNVTSSSEKIDQCVMCHKVMLIDQLFLLLWPRQPTSDQRAEVVKKFSG